MPINKKSSSQNSVVSISVPSDATLLTVAETATILRLSVSAIRSWVLQRRIPFIKLHNKAIRIRRADVDALIAASVVPAHPAKTDGLREAA
jgi:excisionase family DNA binding protein